MALEQQMLNRLAEILDAIQSIQFAVPDEPDLRNIEGKLDTIIQVLQRIQRQS